MKRRHLLNFLLAGMVMPTAGPIYAAERVIASRTWNDNGNIRIVFDLSGPVHFQTFQLDAPPRLIIDLSDAELVQSLSGLITANDLITGARSGRSSHGTRVVLELTHPVNAHAFALTPSGNKGHRLVIDLTHTPSVITALAATTATPAQKPTGAARDLVVVIDAGHGGKDPGAVGAAGEQEKLVALSIAQLLAKRVNAQKGYSAKLVRNDDVFIPLRKRVEIARARKADMFISVHADAAPRRSASGASVFALSEGGATSTMARWMARQENKADLMGAADLLPLKDKDPVLAGVILDMSMTSTISTSLDLGHSVLQSIGKVAGTHQKRVEQAGFAVLKSPDIPSILVETGFMSNPRDCRRLVEQRHQQQVAAAIFAGVQSYFANRPPEGTYLAHLKAQQLG